MTLGSDIKLQKTKLIEQINLATLKFSSTEVTCYIQELQDFIFLNWGPSRVWASASLATVIDLWCEMTLSEYLGIWMAEDLGQQKTASRYTDIQMESKEAEKSL